MNAGDASRALCAVSRDAFDVLILDLDGVLTRTARLHAQAWAALFDDFLRARSARTGAPYVPFDPHADYLRHVDGKPRYVGVESFLAARGVQLPPGTPDDPPEVETVCGLGNRKQALFQALLAREGVETYPHAVDLVRAARALAFRTAVVTSSKNCALILETAGIADLFDVQLDGHAVEAGGLPGKPAPDTFLEAARRLGVEPRRAVVLEDALAGVEAGRRGGFGLVVGVDRAGHADALRQAGADVVLDDLSRVELEPATRAGPGLPSALAEFDAIVRRLRGRRLAVFLDYDGTLTPIVARPELATLAEPMRATLARLAAHLPVAVVSGRDLQDVRRLVGLEPLFYAGSHGFDIAGPGGQRMEHPQGGAFLADLDQAEAALRARLAAVAGALVERKRFAIAVHYRLVAEHDLAAVDRAVAEAHAAHPRLRRTGGKKIHELRPGLDWDKGKAVRWLLRALALEGPDVLALYLGDDETDEDAFRALRADGIGVLVAEHPQRSHAHYGLRDPGEAERFLERLAGLADRRDE